MALELKRILGTGALLAFGLAYLVPLTVFTTFGSVTQLTQGHLPLAYLVTTGAMLFTSVSYALLVTAFPAAGSAYSYARAAFGEFTSACDSAIRRFSRSWFSGARSDVSR